MTKLTYAKLRKNETEIWPCKVLDVQILKSVISMSQMFFTEGIDRGLV